MVIIDHVSIPVADLQAASVFYDAVLATLGLRRRKEREGAIGYGPDDIAPPIFWILARQAEGSAAAGVGLHVSFRTDSRDRVHRFHETALALGGKDAGARASAPTTQPASTAASSSTSTASRSRPWSGKGSSV